MTQASKEKKMINENINFNKFLYTISVQVSIDQ